MTNPRGFDLNQHFARMWSLQIHFFHNQRLAGAIGNSGTGFHGKISLTSPRHGKFPEWSRLEMRAAGTNLRHLAVVAKR
jgi:hypothetical protein